MVLHNIVDDALDHIFTHHWGFALRKVCLSYSLTGWPLNLHLNGAWLLIVQPSVFLNCHAWCFYLRCSDRRDKDIPAIHEFYFDYITVERRRGTKT